MSSLSQINRGKVYNIDGVDLEFKSVEVDADVSKLLEGASGISKEEEIILMTKLIRKMLMESVPDATPEEIDNCLRIKTLFPLIDAFYEVNGMNDEENMSKVEKIKNAITTRQQTKAKSA